MYSAVIVEPREHPALELVLDNFIQNLSNDWNFIIFHGNNNLPFINNIISIYKIIYYTIYYKGV